MANPTPKPGDAKPTGAEVAALITRLIALGLPAGQAGQLVSASVSRRENAAALKDWLKGR